MVCPKCHGEKVTEYVLDYRFRITGSKEQSWDIDTCSRCDGYGVVDGFTAEEIEAQKMLESIEKDNEWAAEWEARHES